VAVLQRRLRKNPQHRLCVCRIRLAVAVVRAAIDQAGFAQRLVAIPRATDRCSATTQLPGDPLAAVTAAIRPQDDQVTHAGVGVRAASRFSLELCPCPRVQYDPSRIHAGIPSGLVGARPSCEADASFI
jgi:hypothetical protein